ncbi:MAG: D-glycero-beta-D-manno-heptose-7-phosphate kinase [Endomicrobiales bacterium]|jgi:D-beta-D-heptose 7-phosphate kinase/D-beta-D-heptose 1-phosphate adenosyltransferase
MQSLIKLIPKFKQQNILVIGDMMVDKFVWGKVSRISPEAPVPVVEVNRETQALGGAGNVAGNLASLGAMVYITGVVGDDLVGEQLRDDLRARNIRTEKLVTDCSRPTSIKTRIIAQHQQVVRVDKEVKGSFSPSVVKNLVAVIEEMIPKVQAVIISDYGKGVVDRLVLSRAIAVARKHGVYITVDPKIEHFQRYKKVSCITPNTKEAIEGMHWRDVYEDKDIAELGRKILKKLNSDSVLITRGEKGMTLLEPNNKITHIPTRAKEVFDVTGAGDTVIATLTLALAAKASFVEAAEIANFAAGVVVAKIGTATVSPEELIKAINNFK